MLSALARVGRGRLYWTALLLFGAALIGVALYFQYVLDHLPCLICIQVRMLVFALIAAAAIGLVLRRMRLGAALGHLTVALVAALFFERAWMLLGIERGTELGDCSFDLGLPAWFALDQWFPALFKVWEACGYTPELAFGITMAEALVVVSAALLVTSIVLLIATLVRR